MPDLFRRDLALAPLGLPVTIRPRCDWDAPGTETVTGIHVGAGLVVHRSLGDLWSVSDGATGLWIAADPDPLRAMRAAYRRLVLERGRPDDLTGTVLAAVTAILRRVRRGLPSHLRLAAAAVEVPHA